MELCSTNGNTDESQCWVFNVEDIPIQVLNTGCRSCSSLITWFGLLNQLVIQEWPAPVVTRCKDDMISNQLSAIYKSNKISIHLLDSRSGISLLGSGCDPLVDLLFAWRTRKDNLSDRVNVLSNIDTTEGRTNDQDRLVLEWLSSSV